MAEPRAGRRRREQPDEAEPERATATSELSATVPSAATLALSVERRPTRLPPGLPPVPGLIDFTTATPQEVVAAYLDLAMRGGQLLTAMRQKEYGTIQNMRIAQLEWAIQHVIDTLAHTDATSALPDAMYCLDVLQRVIGTTT